MIKIPALHKQLQNFNNYEVNACTMNTNDDGTQYYEQCADNDPELYCWSLYGHLDPRKDDRGGFIGGLQHICDFDPGDRLTAEYVCALLKRELETK